MVLQVYDVILLRHGSNPAMAISLAPALPIDLVRADGTGQRDGEAAPIDLKDVAIGLEDAVHELLAVVVVGLVVHDLDADLDRQLPVSYVVANEIQENAAVLATREGCPSTTCEGSAPLRGSYTPLR